MVPIKRLQVYNDEATTTTTVHSTPSIRTPYPYRNPIMPAIIIDKFMVWIASLGCDARPRLQRCRQPIGGIHTREESENQLRQLVVPLWVWWIALTNPQFILGAETKAWNEKNYYWFDREGAPCWGLTGSKRKETSKLVKFLQHPSSSGRL